MSDDKENQENLDAKIIAQVEYYFGNENLPKDRFMKRVMLKYDGWISCYLMLNFHKLKLISNNWSRIVEAIEKSPNKIVQLSDDKKKIRRHPENPLPEKEAIAFEKLDVGKL